MTTLVRLHNRLSLDIFCCFIFRPSFFVHKVSTRYFTLNSEKQLSSLTATFSLHQSCQVVVLFLSYMHWCQTSEIAYIHTQMWWQLGKTTFWHQKSDGTMFEILFLTLPYHGTQRVEKWTLQVQCCTPTLISAIWIIHLTNGNWLLHTKNIWQLKTLRFPLKNDLHHYFPMLPFWLKENGWQAPWRSHLQWKLKMLATVWKH